MSTVTPSAPPTTRPRRRPQRGTAKSSLVAQGEPTVWLTAGALVILLVMITGLLGLVLVQGSGTFWPGPVERFRLAEPTGLAEPTVLMGEVTDDETYAMDAAPLAALGDAQRAQIAAAGGSGVVRRRLVRTGNFELTGSHFHWVSDHELVAVDRPEWAMLLERVEWGRFYGLPTELRRDGQTIAREPQQIWDAFTATHPEVRARRERIKEIETDDVGAVNRRLEHARLAVREAVLGAGKGSAAHTAALAEEAMVTEQAEREFDRLRAAIDALAKENRRLELVLTTADGTEKSLVLGEIVRAVTPNRLGPVGKLGVYASRWKEFLFDDPREANSEGGVFPAIWGTVAMTLIMSLAVVPFGVLAALYLREYAKAGWMVSAVRIAVNNLAGVPSIVFGVFGLGFFCYIVGASIDELLFAARLPNPTYGKGGLLWGALTLALLTLPVVIASTEEALSAVPNSMREGSYACGASKWQTIVRIVLPRALPGIITGAILAMARGAGEVAPLMLVGAVKLAPELPLDGVFPYFHPERSFMHLGFHIYDLGFQSQNSEAARPMVYTTTLLLIVIIAGLNLGAMWLRTRLRRRFATSQF